MTSMEKGGEERRFCGPAPDGRAAGCWHRQWLRRSEIEYPGKDLRSVQIAGVGLEGDDDPGVDLAIMILRKPYLGRDFKDQPVPQEALAVADPELQVGHLIGFFGVEIVADLIAQGLFFVDFLEQGEDQGMGQTVFLDVPGGGGLGPEEPPLAQRAPDFVGEDVFPLIIGVVVQAIDGASLPRADGQEATIADAGVEIVEGGAEGGR